jgi:hypothetical protein
MDFSVLKIIRYLYLYALKIRRKLEKVSISSRKQNTVTLNHESHLEVVYHMIPVRHDVTGTQFSSNLQNQLGISPLIYTKSRLDLDHVFYIYSWAEFLFYFINFGALDFVQLILNACTFYCISHTVSSFVIRSYRKLKFA